MADKKFALVTGTSKGLGLALCEELLKRGYRVAALTRTVTEELSALKGDIQVIPCDVADLESVKAAGEKIDAEAIDIIFNNAGLWLDYTRERLLDDDFSFDTMLPQFTVNAMGPLHIAKVFMPRLLKSQTKRVFNISSEAGSIAECKRVCEYGYCMSKAALNMATKILDNDFAPSGVKVYAVHPGWMNTTMGIRGASGDSFPDRTPQEIALWLCDFAEEQTNRDGIYYDDRDREMPW